MKINTIVKLNLEARTKDLRAEGKSQEEISKILSEETGQQITKHTVSRYFLADEKLKAQVIERSDKLKLKVVDAEINTITKRLEIIDKFLEICEDARVCGDFKAAIMALRGATEAQDSLDERLGKLKARTNNNTVNVLNVQEAIHGARERFINAIVCNNGQNSEGEDSQQFY
jgi:hypothetical protein